MAEKHYDIAVIGGGPAGMAAAWAASRCGADTILIERSSYLGGVLPQCVHDGFGLYSEGKSMTGPRFALLWEEKLRKTPARIELNTSVIEMHPYGSGDAIGLSCVGPSFGGRTTITADRVIIASGCREKTRGQLRIPGTRPAGIMTAGSAQYMINIQNRLPGNKVVILGSGDIGLIMARRLKLEGADVRLVLGQEATGLYRNHIQCIREMDIPFRSGWTIISLHGRGRLKGVMAAPMDENGRPDRTKREYIRCNTLLIATGLIPERDIEGLDKVISQTEERVLFAGNVDHIHDLVDGAVIQGVRCGIMAARADSVPEDVQKTADIEIPKEKAGAQRSLQPGHMADRCTGCPSSCLLDLVTDGDRIIEVNGAGCERGPKIVLEQAENPQRIFTGTIKYGDQQLLPVYTSDAVPVRELKKIARLCRRIQLSRPVMADQVIKENIGSLGVDLLAATDGR